MKNIRRILFSEEQIRYKIEQTGRQIERLYDGKPLLIVGILRGSFMFISDLVRSVNIPCEVGFIAAESYSGTESTGTVNITLDLKQDISNYHVIIAEDIIDTGRTLKAVADILSRRNPLSLRIVTLLDKPSRRVADINADISLFTIPDYFVVGYGLDYNEKYRTLPYIAEFKGDTP